MERSLQEDSFDSSSPLQVSSRREKWQAPSVLSTGPPQSQLCTAFNQLRVKQLEEKEENPKKIPGTPWVHLPESPLSRHHNSPQIYKFRSAYLWQQRFQEATGRGEGNGNKLVLVQRDFWQSQREIAVWDRQTRPVLAEPDVSRDQAQDQSTDGQLKNHSQWIN